jgi:DnaJ family protein C protein 11
LFSCVKMSADASPRRRVRELRHEHADYIAQKRAEAHEAILLLERPTAQRVTAEREKDGLIIISAHYGRATNFSDRGIRLGGGSGTGVNQNGRIPVQPSHSAEHGEESLHSEEEEVVVDVTVPVQALVQDSRLYIPGGRAKVSRSVARVILRSTRSKGKLITP